MKYQAVLFDLGGTLVKTAEVPEIFRRIIETFGLRFDIERINKALEVNTGNFDVETGQVELGESFWNKWNANLLTEIGIENGAEHLGRRISAMWWDYASLEIYADVLPTLSDLATNNVLVGIVTNALRNDYEQMLRRVGIERYFDVIVGTDDCNAAKPDPRMFQHALKKLNLKPFEAIFVGDDLRRDYEGSKKVGMKPVLIDREGKDTADIESVSRLTEIFKYL